MKILTTMNKKTKYNNKNKLSIFTRDLSNINRKRVMVDSLTKLNPLYLARTNAVMFTVEVVFLVVLAVGVGLSNIPKVYASQSQVFYYASAAILIITVWFSTFSEALSEAQARARVDSLRSLEKEVTARKLLGEGESRKEVIVASTSLKPGDEVLVYAGEIIPRDGLVCEGKAFIDESMMTGESNPVFKEKDDHVIGGTRIASDKLRIEITAEAGRSFLDEMVNLIESATRPKTKNEIALTILLAGLSLIFIMVVGSLLFFAYFLGYIADIAMLIALLVALMPTTIGGLLSAIGVAGITRIGRDNIIAKSGKGIEAAGDCDILILDKTGTITEGSRGANEFVPLQKYTERDVGQAAFAASIHDPTHEGKSMVHLAEEKRFIPPLVEKILTARRIDFSAETRFSGIEFIPNKIMALDKELQEEATAIHKFEDGNGEGQVTTTNGNAKTKFATMLLELDRRNEEVKILKGSLDAVLKFATHVNEAEVKWKAQEISKEGETPMLVAINDEAIGLVALKDNLKENICQKLDEVRATGITGELWSGSKMRSKPTHRPGRRRKVHSITLATYCHRPTPKV